MALLRRWRLPLITVLLALMLMPLVIVDTPFGNPVESIGLTPEESSALSTGDSWLTGWCYRKQHNISSQNGAGQNYTVLFDVNGGDGTDSGNHLYLNGKAQDDLDDLRFTASDGNTLLSYWLENVVSGGTTDYFYNKGTHLVSYNGNYPSTYYDIDGNRTYVFVNGEGNDPYVLYWDHENSTWSEPAYIGDSLIQGDDHHGAPVGWVDDNGYIHSIFGGHAESTMQHYKSDNPNSIDSFSWVNNIDSANVATYPSVLYDAQNDVVHLAYRYLAGAAEYDLVYKNSTDDGSTWSSRHTLVNAPSGVVVYPEAQILDFYDPKVLHLSWRHYIEASDISEDVHYMWMNVTTGGLYNVTNDYQGTTINYDDADVIALDYGDASQWVGAVVRAKVYSNDNVYILWCNLTNSDPFNTNVSLLYWNATTTSWVNGGIVGEAEVGDRLGNDFIIHDATNLTAFSNEGYNITKFTWDGSSWTKSQSIYNSTARQLGVTTVPYYWNGSYPTDLQVTFSEFASGATDCKGYAWGEDGIVQRETSAYCKAWVRIPDDISSSNYTMYIYYGNPSASDAGNGTDTFIQWDDFDSGYSDGDPPKASRGWWIKNKGGSDLLEIDTNVGGASGLGLRYTEDGAGGANLQVFNNYTQTNNVAINFRFYWVTRSNQFYVYVYDLDDSAPWAAIITRSGNSYITKCHDGATEIHYTPTSDQLREAQWYKIEEQLLNTTDATGTHNHTVAYISYAGETGGSGDGYDVVRFSAHDDYTDDYFIDDFFVRKYIYPEPAHSTYGNEEFSFYDYVDQISNEDGSADVGTHSSFVNQQGHPDSTYDTLTEGDVGGVGNDYEDYFQSYSTNVDSYPDVGTETNPQNAQDLGDSDYMNLQEGNQAGEVDEYIVPDGLSGAAIWSTTGTTPWIDVQDQPTNIIYTTTNSLVSQWYTFGSTSGAGSGFTVNCSIYWNAAVDCYISNVEIDWTGDGTADWSTGTSTQTWAWDNLGTVTGLDTSTEINAARIRFTYNKGAGGPDQLSIDAARLGVTQSGGTDYELDFEYQWTDANYSETYEEVCINVETYQQTGSETLKAWEWTGSDWASLGTLSQNGWNNFTSAYLTGSTYYIKINDTDQSADADQDSWNIDSIILHTWSTATNYRLDLEEQWTDARYDQDFEYLCIKWGSVNTEELNISVWYSSSWNFIFQVNTSHANSWTNISVSSYLDAATFTIKFGDTDITSDSTQGTWQKDSCLLWTYPAPNVAPQVDVAPTVDNPTDTDNLYARYTWYYFEVNISDNNGANDIHYVELTLATDNRVTEFWTIKFNNTDNTFTNTTDTTGKLELNTTASAYYQAGNDLDIEFWIMVNWSQQDSIDCDAKVYAEDYSQLDNTTWYETPYDIEGDLELSVGPTLNDGAGTANIGELDDTITASGTVVYHGGTVYPSADEIDIWIGSSEYGTQVGPWNMTNYEDTGGTFSGSVYADDAVGQDTFTFKAIEQGGSYGDTDLFASTESALYTATRLNVTIEADETSPSNGQQVNFTLTVQYEHDGSTCTTYSIQFARNGTLWYTFENANKTLFNDTNSNSIYYYFATSSGDGVSEGTHGLSTANPFINNTEWVTWAGGASQQKFLYDEIIIVEDISQTISLERDYSDSLVISDAPDTAAAFVRVYSEALAVVDGTISLAASFLRLLFETLAVAGSVVFSIGKKFEELIGVQETISLASAFTRNFSESFTIDYAYSASKMIYKTLSETIILAFQHSTHLSASRTFYESMTVAATLGTVLSASRTMYENFTLAFDHSTTSGFVRSFYEEVTFNESISVEKFLQQFLYESITVSTSYALQKDMVRVLAENIIFGVDHSTAANMSKNLWEQVTFNESCTPEANPFGSSEEQFLYETITVSYMIENTASFVNHMNESFTLSDTIATVFNAVQTMSEGITVGEAHATVMSAARVFSENVLLAFDYNTASGFTRVFSEGITLNETTDAEKFIEKFLYESVTVAFGHSTAASHVQQLSESITVSFSYSTDKTGLWYQTMFESITSSETKTATRNPDSGTGGDSVGGLPDRPTPDRFRFPAEFTSIFLFLLIIGGGIVIALGGEDKGPLKKRGAKKSERKSTVKTRGGGKRKKRDPRQTRGGGQRRKKDALGIRGG